MTDKLVLRIQDGTNKADPYVRGSFNGLNFKIHEVKEDEPTWKAIVAVGTGPGTSQAIRAVRAHVAWRESGNEGPMYGDTLDDKKAENLRKGGEVDASLKLVNEVYELLKDVPEHDFVLSVASQLLAKRAKTEK